MTTLVTGATGFVGSAVARRLLLAGHNVVVMKRHSSDLRNVTGLDVQTIQGDLRDPDSLQRAVRGCEYLFHVAADYRLWIPDPTKVYQTNVEGTRNLITAALKAGVEKIVYTSSVATLGFNQKGIPADEMTPVTLDDMIGHYKRSKYLAEQTVQDLVNTMQAPIVIVNPSTPVGPRDVKPTPTGQMIVNMLAGRMPAYVDTGLNVVHVDDVAGGHLLAFEKGLIGERYVLGGENMTLLSILEQIADSAGLRAPRLRIPHGLILPLAWASERIAGITGKEPFATVDGVRMACKYMYFSSHKAQLELGYRPRPARQGLTDAVAWFLENNYV